ncbi:glycosyltransferase family 4 protein [Treponema brennaborense]|uniref:glycosyltransferase family 4 protein n=1 Tax=Treponema brennaborense TaxID=81028 RepID=UPI00069022D6|nr:glycosyltransferase family 4 protein [Treponema brennaborense]
MKKQKSHSENGGNTGNIASTVNTTARAKIYKIDGVGVNLERFRPVRSPEEKTTLRKELGFSPEDFILIYTAEFIPRKNHRLLFDILPELKLKIPELKVVLCGKGELLEPYRQLASEHGMDYVTFTGYTKRVADYCRASDVLVMPSHQEGLPLSMIESIATGLPVVASKIRGHVDVVEDCVNGFLFEPSDCSGFVKAVYTLYKNPVLRTEMGLRNVERAKLFSVDTAVSRMANLYRKIMQNTL